MNKLTLSALTATAIFAMPAFAQTANPTAPAMPSGTASAMTEQQIANLWRASKLDGVNLYNTANEKIGEIDDVLIDRSGKAMAVVVDAGGFLGIGSHRVALRFEDVKFEDMPRGGNVVSNATTTTTTTTSRNANAPGGAPATTVSTDNVNRSASASNRMYPDHAVINMTKDQLKALPQVRYPR